MEEQAEKRGPVEKGAKGWPINYFGIAALAIFAAVALVLIGYPLLKGKNQSPSQSEVNTITGKITSPTTGQIVKDESITLEFTPENPGDVTKVEFLAKTYAEGKWEKIAETSQAPFKVDWNIPENYKNKAVAFTSHVYDKQNNRTKDPGGWREGIIILTP